ncbi:MAG: division/cell wall cluster transcriptional repressor MraZ [Lachnospiraceae bacterium]|mgnify:FL=1|nr:division/cell wall cluster transcriptional repressor MraZ [Lachnospiraceae bacterium]
MFMGEYSHSIDAKGRLIIPSRFRDELGANFVLTKGLDGCLSLYPQNEWRIFEKKLRDLPLISRNARIFTRFFVASATPCTFDKQGRILIPEILREYANLEKNVVLTGNINRIEIWSKRKWSENSNYDDMNVIAKELQDIGMII